MRCKSNACVAVSANILTGGVCRPTSYFKNGKPCFLLEALSSCESGYCRIEDSLCGDSLLADLDVAALVEGATAAVKAVSEALKSIGIDLDAIGDKLTEIGNQIAGAFDCNSPFRMLASPCVFRDENHRDFLGLHPCFCV